MTPNSVVLYAESRYPGTVARCLGQLKNLCSSACYNPTYCVANSTTPARLQGGMHVGMGWRLGPSPDGFQGWGRMSLAGSLPLKGYSDPRVRLQVADAWEAAGAFTAIGQQETLEGLTATDDGWVALPCKLCRTVTAVCLRRPNQPWLTSMSSGPPLYRSQDGTEPAALAPRPQAPDGRADVVRLPVGRGCRLGPCQRPGPGGGGGRPAAAGQQPGGSQ